MKLITNLMLEKTMMTMRGFNHENQCIQTPTMHTTTMRRITQRMIIAVLLTFCPFRSYMKVCKMVNAVMSMACAEKNRSFITT